VQTSGKSVPHRGSDKVRGSEGMEVTLLTSALGDTHAPHTHTASTRTLPDWGRDT
jgi:hypothetical protein